MNQGKHICNELKEIRRSIAYENGIALDIPECTYDGPCDGTCPRCEAELQHLEQELTLRAALGKAAVVAGLTLGLTAGTLTATAQETLPTRSNDSNGAELKQSDTCIFRGCVMEEKSGEPHPFANVIIKSRKKVVGGARTDLDGNFTVRVPKGKYDVVISGIGYKNETFQLDLTSDEVSVKAITIQESSKTPMMMGIVTVSKRAPLIDIGHPENGERIDADRIKHFPN